MKSPYPNKMKQLSKGGNVEANLKGKERIFSIIDTEKMIELSSNIKSDDDLRNLGKYVYDVVKKQDTIN